MTVRPSDSHLGRRRAFRSRGAKLKPCGMTLPQLELWDRGRWAWGEIPFHYCTGVHTAAKPASFLSNSFAKWVLQETDKCLGGSDSRGQKFWIKIMGAMKFPVSADSRIILTLANCLIQTSKPKNFRIEEPDLYTTSLKLQVWLNQMKLVKSAERFKIKTVMIRINDLGWECASQRSAVRVEELLAPLLR